jgi:hypothetical protein
LGGFRGLPTLREKPVEATILNLWAVRATLQKYNRT